MCSHSKSHWMKKWANLSVFRLNIVKQKSVDGHKMTTKKCKTTTKRLKTSTKRICCRWDLVQSGYLDLMLEAGSLLHVCAQGQQHFIGLSGKSTVWRHKGYEWIRILMAIILSRLNGLSWKKTGSALNLWMMFPLLSTMNVCRETNQTTHWTLFYQLNTSWFFLIGSEINLILNLWYVSEVCYRKWLTIQL